MRYSVLSYLFSILACFAVVFVPAQQMQITLVDDTLLHAEVHPTNPVLFHFEAFNPSENTILVDIVKSGAVHPQDWDISICTTACLPPETDEAIFPIGAMLDEEVSIYFFPRSAGSGSVDIYMQSQADPNETYEVTLYLEATQPTGVEDSYHPKEFIHMGDILLFETSSSQKVSIHDIRGRILLEDNLPVGRSEIDISSFMSGVYTLISTSDDGATGAWKVWKD